MAADLGSGVDDPRATASELLTRAAFAIGAKRIAPLWWLLSGIAETDWHTAIDMDNAEVAVTDYASRDWPDGTRLPDQQALPLDELAVADAIYAYSFIVTNLDVATADRAVTVEHC